MINEGWVMPYPVVDRFVAPTRQCPGEFGTIWKVGEDKKKYIQTSRDEEKPHWMPLGEFMAIALDDYTANGKFLQELLVLFERNQHSRDSLSKILEVMTSKS
jgi:hypothetical protein